MTLTEKVPSECISFDCLCVFLCSSFNNVVSTSDYIVSNSRRISEKLTRKNIKGNGLVQFKETRAKPVRRVGLRAEIWTRDLLNMKQECKQSTITFVKALVQSNPCRQIISLDINFSILVTASWTSKLPSSPKFRVPSWTSPQSLQASPICPNLRCGCEGGPIAGSRCVATPSENITKLVSAMANCSVCEL
jgi:hypothetical protein